MYLEEHLVEALEADGRPVSMQINEAVRWEIERRRRRQSLSTFCDGPSGKTESWSAEDGVEITRIIELLGG